MQGLNVRTAKHGWLLRIFGAMGADPTAEEYVHPPDVLDDVWLFINSIGDRFTGQIGDQNV